MKIGCGEQPSFRTQVNTCTHGLLYDLVHLWFMKSIQAYQEVEQSGKSRYGRDESESARSQDSGSFPKGGQTVASFYQVIERAHQEHYVDTLVVLGQFPSVAEFGAHSRMTCLGLTEMDLDGLDHVNPMAAFCEPGRVDPRPASNVENVQRTRRQVAIQDLLGARLLERARWKPSVQPVRFSALLVVRAHIGIEFWHPAIIGERGP